MALSANKLLGKGWAVQLDLRFHRLISVIFLCCCAVSCVEFEYLSDGQLSSTQGWEVRAKVRISYYSDCS